MANEHLKQETSNRVLLAVASGIGSLVLLGILCTLYPTAGWLFYALLGCPIAIAAVIDRAYVKHLERASDRS